MKPWSQDWLIAAGACPGFCSMKRLEVFLLPLDEMLVHRRSPPRNLLGFPQQFAGTHLYSWMERGTVRVKCLAQEHSTMSPARARTRTARSGVERTNHEANPLRDLNIIIAFCFLLLNDSWSHFNVLGSRLEFTSRLACRITLAARFCNFCSFSHR